MNIDNDDEEEVLGRKIFKEFNLEKENSNSFTILIENVRVHDWNSIFVKIYGEPRIPNGNESKGRHWDHQNYNIDGMQRYCGVSFLKYSGIYTFSKHPYVNAPCPQGLLALCRARCKF